MSDVELYLFQRWCEVLLSVDVCVCGELQESKLSVWVKDEDYVRMDGSTGAQSRKRFTANFNDATNER